MYETDPPSSLTEQEINAVVYSTEILRLMLRGHS